MTFWSKFLYALGISGCVILFIIFLGALTYVIGYTFTKGKKNAERDHIKESLDDIRQIQNILNPNKEE